jgi:phage baseplate assembly protein W
MPTPRYFGYNYPFWTPPSSILRPQADTRIIKNDLLQLLLTSPGERRMRPTYGTDIRKFPFQMGDDEALLGLRQSIRIAIDRFEPRVILKSINLNLDADNNSLAISVLCALSRDPNIELAVDLVTTNPATIVPTQQATV